MNKINIKVMAFIIPFIFVYSVGYIFAEDKLPITMHIKEGSFMNSLGMVFNEIPAGTFMMGSNINDPVRFRDEIFHKVTLTKSFFMLTTEVTQGQWKAIMKHNPSIHKKCGNDCPVETVSWNDIQAFINKLNKRGEGIYRLPTEAEWEYAARAGTSTSFNTGDCIYGDYENFTPDSMESDDIHDSSLSCTSGVYRVTPLPVASLKPNAWGLFDMHGNVSEWVHDWYGPYEATPVVDPIGPESGLGRVIRGGNYDVHAGECRSASRSQGTPDEKYITLGFRLVWEAGQLNLNKAEQSESAGQNKHEIEGEASGDKMKSSPLLRKD